MIMLSMTHLSGFGVFSASLERMAITYQLTSSSTPIEDLVWRIRRYSGWNGTTPCDLYLTIPSGSAVSGPLSLKGFPVSSSISLVIESGGTLSGNGSLGDVLSLGMPRCTVINNGTISGSSGKIISVQADLCSFTNNGTLSSAAGGTTLTITGNDTIITNTGAIKSTNGTTISADQPCTIKNTGQISSTNGTTIIGNTKITWNPSGTITGPVS